MNAAIRRMIDKYHCQAIGDYVVALREVLQSIALLALWRSKFFEKAAFYGGTALRLLHGLDRYSEDIDFSLLRPEEDFSLTAYDNAICREMESFGFEVTVTAKRKELSTPIESAFIKADTRQQLLVIAPGRTIEPEVHRNQVLKIRLEVDTDPPGKFETDTQYVLQPVPFSVRLLSLPDLFAGKMHAVLCRNWKSRIKGRDWYDLVWYVANYPDLHLVHLEERMRQSGHYTDDTSLGRETLLGLLHARIDNVDIGQIKTEASPYLSDTSSLDLWGGDFFHSIVERIRIV